MSQIPTKARTVYVVNKGLHSYEKACQYGRLEYLSVGMMSRVAITNMMRQFGPKINESHKEDLILVSGVPTMNVIACVLFVLKHKCLNLLLYSPNLDTYLMRNVVFEEPQ